MGPKHPVAYFQEALQELLRMCLLGLTALLIQEKVTIVIKELFSKFMFKLMVVGESGPHGQHVSTTAENIDLGAVFIHTQLMEAGIVLEIPMRICHVMLKNVQVE